MLNVKKKVTINTVAKATGYSFSTVAYVLRGQAKKVGIADSTVLRIKEVAGELGYVPNVMARGLKKQQSKVVTVLLRDLKMNWADNLTEGMDKVLLDRGYTSFLAVNRDDLGRIKKEVNHLIQRQDEGVICYACVGKREDYSMLLERKLPLVFVSDYPEDFGSLDGISTVLWDYGPPIKKIISHFAKQGRKRVGFLGTRHGVISDLKRYGFYCQALKEVGLPCLEDIHVWGKIEDVETEKRLREIFSNRSRCPDAMFALNDYHAAFTLELADKMGIKVPDDIAIVGVGDLPISNHMGLTSIVEPLEIMGTKASEILLGLIDGCIKGPVHETIVCDDIVFRKTA